MVNCIFRDQVKKQNFLTFHMRVLETFADVILVRAETIKSFAIYFTICWIIFVSNNRGAPLLGLAKSIYYFLGASAFNSLPLKFKQTSSKALFRESLDKRFVWCG